MSANRVPNPHSFRHFSGRADQPRSTIGMIPPVGAVICWIASREAIRVTRIDEIHQANWADDTRKAWAAAGEPAWETWAGRERGVGYQPVTGGKERARRLCPWWNGEQWAPLTQPYPACVECGLLWPCPCDDRNREAAEALAEVERLAAILPGCCWACNEPITGRHHSIVFDGENLLLPGGGPVAFHTSYSRKAARPGRYGALHCRGEAEKYEDRWVFAGEGRRVRLRCGGVQHRHYGGFVECSLLDDCPGPDASHRAWHHCTTQAYTGGANYVPGEEIDPNELRPPTRCAGKGCRGRSPADQLGSPAEPA